MRGERGSHRGSSIQPQYGLKQGRDFGLVTLKKEIAS
jgi:hypothetical protein